MTASNETDPEIAAGSPVPSITKETVSKVKSVEISDSLAPTSTERPEVDVDENGQPSKPTPDSTNRPEDEPIAPVVSASENPYSSFGKYEKMLIILCATLGGLFSPFTTNIYFPALDTIASDLGVSISKVNLTITTYMIFQGLAPTFISAITDTQGRRPTYIIGFTVYIAANIGLALNNTYAGLLVLRCIQSCGSSGMVTLQQAIIADVVTSAERGKYIGITSITSILAPSVAPIVGGVLSQNLGWHAIFWFLLIMSGVYLVPLVLFQPETSRKLVGDGSILPPRWNMTLLNVWRNHRRKHSGTTEAQEQRPERAQRQKLKWPNPLDVLVFFVTLESAVLLFFSSIAYAAFYAVTSTITVQFGEIYGLDSTQQGLLFLPQAVGSLIAAVFNGILLDKNYRRYARKYGRDPGKKRQIDLHGFPIERARIELALPLFVLNSVATVAYGWFLEFRVHLAAPVVMLVIIGYTLLAGFNALNVLYIDVYRSRAASASAASNLSRCLLGAGMTAVVNPMINAMGRGWCFTFTALVQIACLPVLWVCMRKGVEWRARAAEKATLKAQT